MTRPWPLAHNRVATVPGSHVAAKRPASRARPAAATRTWKARPAASGSSSSAAVSNIARYSAGLSRALPA